MMGSHISDHHYPQYPISYHSKNTAGTVDVEGTMNSRLGTMYTDLQHLCCKSQPACGKTACMKSCPGSCWISKWVDGPSINITQFRLSAITPSYYTPTLIVPQNYTNYSKHNGTYQTFEYSQSFTDTVTVTNSETLTVSESIETKVDIEIASVTTTIGFSFSTSRTESVTNSTTKSWSSTYGPVYIPPCNGVYTECYILTATYNPTFTAVYVVDGLTNDECDGNIHWDYRYIAQFASYGNICVECDTEVCANPPITLDNSLSVTGTWNGIFGSEVVCSSKPYPLPPNQCS